MPEPIVTIAGGAALEGNFINFTVSLSEPPADAITIEYNTYSRTADRGDDVYNYSSYRVSGTVTFAAGETTQTISIRVSSESLDELDENVLLQLFNPVGANFGTNVHTLSAIGWALDNDGPGNNRAIAVSDAVVTEAGGGTAQFVVSLSQAFDTDRTFSYETFNGSARAGSDYNARSGTVTFLAGQTEAVVEVNLRNDNIAEAAESFGLAITGAHGVTGASGTAHILDTDAAEPVLSVESGKAIEGEFIPFIFRLSEPPADAVTVEYDTGRGSGDIGVDVYNYSSYRLADTVTFAPGETVKTVYIRVSSESLDEMDEHVLLQVHNADGATFGDGIHSLSAIGWALDNDGPGLNRAMAVSKPVVVEENGGKAVFTVSLSEAFDTDRSFSYETFNGSARAGSDYAAQTGTVTFRAGQTEAQVVVDILDDRQVEAGESFGLAVTGAHNVDGASGTALILNDDGSRPVISLEGDAAVEGQFLAYTVRLSEPASDVVTVQYNTISGSGAINDDVYDYSSYRLTGTITFDPGETVRKIYIRTRADSGDELDETVLLELRNPTGATFAGANRVLNSLGWVLDDDGPGLNRTVAVSGGEVREGPGGRVVVFAVELSTASENDITLRFETRDGTARAGADYAERSGNVTFVAGQTRAEIAVPVKNDLRLEGSEQFYLRVAPPFPGELSSSATAATGTATIIDGTIRGTDGANRLTGTSLADRIEGFGGKDVINGQAGNDILNGGGGNDRINGQNGNDQINGGTGNDSLFGNDGNDTLKGAAGNDLLNGGAGRDRMEGGSGNDRYVIDSGDVVIEARNGGIDTVEARHSMKLGANLENIDLLGGANLNGTGNGLANTLTGNSGRNVLKGEGGNDNLFGQAGNDRLLGGAGNDRLFGGVGNDTILGGSGRDTLRGDVGSDRLYGGADGAQRDVFVFRSESDSAVGLARDQIHQFRHGVDDIDLRGIDANEDRRGNQAFDFGGRQADEYSVWYVRRGDDVIVRGDNDGDGRPDFEIFVDGIGRLTAEDFLL